MRRILAVVTLGLVDFLFGTMTASSQPTRPTPRPRPTPPVTAKQLCASEWRQFDIVVQAERARVESESPHRTYIAPGSANWLIRFNIGQQYNPNGWHIDHSVLAIDDNLVIDDWTANGDPVEKFRAVLYNTGLNNHGDFQEKDLLRETDVAFGNTDLALWAHNQEGD